MISVFYVTYWLVVIIQINVWWIIYFIYSPKCVHVFSPIFFQHLTKVVHIRWILSLPLWTCVHNAWWSKCFPVELKCVNTGMSDKGFDPSPGRVSRHSRLMLHGLSTPRSYFACIKYIKILLLQTRLRKKILLHLKEKELSLANCEMLIIEGYIWAPDECHQ